MYSNALSWLKCKSGGRDENLDQQMVVMVWQYQACPPSRGLSYGAIEGYGNSPGPERSPLQLAPSNLC